jgi:hypothetical protein
MDIHLVVVRPFGQLVRGDVVTETARITEILSGEHAHNVVRVLDSAKEN